MKGYDAVRLASRAMPEAYDAQGWPRWTDGQRGRLAVVLERDDRPTLAEMDVAAAVRTLMRHAPGVLA